MKIVVASLIRAAVVVLLHFGVVASALDNDRDAGSGGQFQKQQRFPRYTIRRRGGNPMSIGRHLPGESNKVSNIDLVRFTAADSSRLNTGEIRQPPDIRRKKRILRRLDIDETVYEECDYDVGTYGGKGYGSKGYGSKGYDDGYYGGKGDYNSYGGKGGGYRHDRSLAVGYDYGEYQSDCDRYGKGDGTGYGKGYSYGKGYGEASGSYPPTGKGYGKGNDRRHRRTGKCVCNECGCYEYCVIDYGDTGDDPICETEEPKDPAEKPETLPQNPSKPDEPEKPDEPDKSPPETPGTNLSMDTGLPEYAYSNDFGGAQGNGGGGGSGGDDDAGDPDVTPNRDGGGSDGGSDPAVFLDFAPPPPREEEPETKPYYVIGGGD